MFKSVVILTLLLPLPAWAEMSPRTLSNFPNPGKGGCGGTTSLDRVCDPDEVLSEQARLEIQRAIYIIEHETPHECGDARVAGFQVAVALARSIEGGKAAAGDFARGLHNAWGVGHAPCNDGVVLLLSVDDRRAHVSTGAGVRAIITDAHVASTIDRMRPALRRGDYGAAVLGAVSDMRAALEAGEEGTSVPVRSESTTTAQLIMNSYQAIDMHTLIFFAFLALVALERLVACCSSRPANDWEAVRRRLLNMERLAAEGAAAAARRGGPPVVPLASRMPCCPICMEDFPAAAAAQPAAAGEATVVTLPCHHREFGRRVGAAAHARCSDRLPSSPPCPAALPGFHVTCLDGWFGTHGRSTCPVCRADVIHPGKTP